MSCSTGWSVFLLVSSVYLVVISSETKDELFLADIFLVNSSTILFKTA